MKFKYVGQKTDGERAFERETGIVWMPGDVREVADAEIAAQMVKHPTVWECLGDAATIPEPARKRQPVNAGHIDDEALFDALEEQDEARRAAAQAPQAPADPLAGLDDAGVRAFAKARGLKVQGIALTKGENLRAKVRAALGA